MADITKVAANVRPLPGAIVKRGIASAALNVGDAVYKTGTGDKWAKTDANAASTAKGRGVVVSAPGGATAAVTGDAIDIVTLGPVTGFSGMTPGAVEYVSETAGALADAAPSTAAAVVWSMGYALNATDFYVNPGNEVIPGSAIANLTENSTTIGGSQESNVATLAMSVSWNGSSVYPSAADAALIIDGIRECMAKTNAILAALRAQGIIAN